MQASRDPNYPNQKLRDDKEDNLVDTSRYQRLVRKLIYLSHTQLDIAFVVSMVSQFMHLPNKKHLEVVYQTLRYLKVHQAKVNTS